MTRLITTGAVAALIAGGLLVAAPADASSGHVSALDAHDRGGSARPVGAARAGGAAVTVGSVAVATDWAGCTVPAGGAVFIQQAEDTGTNTYTVPGAGVVTSVSHFAPATGAGQIRAVFMAPGATAADRVVQSYTDLFTVAVGATNTFPVRVPVTAGTTLALDLTASGMACGRFDTLPNVMGIAGLDPTTTKDFHSASTAPGVVVNISAVWEPDVDGDGYGDVSQDACPQSKVTQAACPAPDTIVTKAPKNHSTRRRAKIKFASTVPGSTFTCTVDRKPTKACRSPFKKRFKYGKHKVLVTATSPFGIVDPSPATVKFKVKKPTR